ncbi:MAG: DNA alkylation repair protein [Lachnospiraceae bacterium]|nr:DNA alkylation repair protein [Lachnospiraceae bacterium]
MVDIIQAKLFELQDLDYKEFHSKLMPTVPHEKVIGVRTPTLRKLAKELMKDEHVSNAIAPISQNDRDNKQTTSIEEFLDTLPHEYYEENNLHAFLIEQIADYDTCIDKINTFLPYVDNWATCDMMRPKCFKKHNDELLVEIDRWLASSDVYAVRFGIEMLMVYFLDDKFKDEYLFKVSQIRSEEYYINMMMAWYFATALAKQYDATVTLLEDKTLPIWVHNKTIQKAIESYRVSDERKNYLRKLRRK